MNRSMELFPKMRWVWGQRSNIGASVIGHLAVGKSDVGVSEGAVLGRAALHAFAPHPKRAGFQRVAHQANDVRLSPSRALLNGLKGRPVFPSHLNDGRDIAF